MGCRWQLHMLIKKEVENEMDDEEIENNEEDGGEAEDNVVDEGFVEDNMVNLLHMENSWTVQY